MGRRARVESGPVEAPDEVAVLAAGGESVLGSGVRRKPAAAPLVEVGGAVVAVAVADDPLPAAPADRADVDPPVPPEPLSVAEVVERICAEAGARVEYRTEAIVVHHVGGAMQLPSSLEGCVELPTVLWKMLEKRR